MATIEARTTKAVMDLTQALAYTDQEGTHYHLTDGRELTILASLNDLSPHLTGEVEDRAFELDDPHIDRISNDTSGVEKIQVAGCGEDEVTTFRVRPCDDPTCARALRDYWL